MTPHKQYGNVYNKYTSNNPIEKALVRNFLSSINKMIISSGARTIHEVGCGEGFLLDYLINNGHADIKGSDISTDAIAEAKLRLNGRLETNSLYSMDLFSLSKGIDSAELILLSEVLEHLEYPEKALIKLSGLAEPFLLISVPLEPLWRLMNICRGKYLNSLGNTPGHIQHFSRKRIRQLLTQHYTIVRESCTIPWQIYLCKKKYFPL